MSSTLSTRPMLAADLVVDGERRAVERVGDLERRVVVGRDGDVHHGREVAVVAAEVADGHREVVGELVLEAGAVLPLRRPLQVGVDAHGGAAIEGALARADLVELRHEVARCDRSRSGSRCSGAAG